MSVTPVTKESSNLALKPSPSKPRWARVDTLPYLLLVPSILLIILIDLYPFLTAAVYSLQNGSLLAPGTFVGLQIYLSTFTDPEFQYSVVFSAIFAAFGVVGSYLLGLGLALLLIQNFPLRGLFRVLLIIPHFCYFLECVPLHGGNSVHYECHSSATDPGQLCLPDCQDQLLGLLHQ